MYSVGNGHDLALPEWGPYSKKIAGISHISDKTKGWRFDFSISPGLFRRNFMVPDVRTESQYFPWESSPDLNYYCHRHELEWKDKVYTDISFSRIQSNSRLFRCEIVNNTDINQNLHLLLLANMNFPDSWPAIPFLPEKAFWVDALDYSELEFAKPRPQDNLNYDGSRKAEQRKSNFVNASAVALGFGNDSGDSIKFDFISQSTIEKAELIFRYCLEEGKKLVLQTQGIIDRDIELKGTGKIELFKVPAGKLNSESKYSLTLISCGGAGLELDGFVVCPLDKVDEVSFKLESRNTKAEKMDSPEIKNGVILKYPDLPFYYGIKWNYDSAICRFLTSADLKKTVDYNRGLYNAYYSEADFTRENNEYHYSTLLTPVTLPANSKKIISGIVCNGSLDEVKSILEHDCSPQFTEEIYELNRADKVNIPHSLNGKDKLFSQQIMAAMNLLNIVFPIYAKRGYIRHRTPGKIFDCLYTWDSGFIGLGLMEVDLKQALENLDAYLTEPNDKETAFIHHGSPVPVQIYLFKELYNRIENNREILEYFYPRLKQYHDFLTGKTGSSTTATLKSGMLKTWDYFYNSGGWDDYPAQWSLEENKDLRVLVAPAVNTVHAIRTAKILRYFAHSLEKYDDVENFDKEIQYFSNALHENSWDDASGYFSYVLHDDNGQAKEFYRYSNGENYNKGLDGVSPLVANICTGEQKAKLFEHLESSSELWTETGLSTVDQSAEYFRNDGYWNGSVWMPHQWFLWKACLDHNKADFAWQIADTALNIWQKEVDYSYSCFEHFSVETGRGGGWYQFSGLSTPVLSFYSAYYKPGHLTGGFDLWIKQLDYNSKVMRAELELEGNPREYSTLIAVVDSAEKYKVSYNNQPVSYNERIEGVLEISLPCASSGKLFIE